VVWTQTRKNYFKARLNNLANDLLSLPCRSVWQLHCSPVCISPWTHLCIFCSAFHCNEISYPFKYTQKSWLLNPRTYINSLSWERTCSRGGSAICKTPADNCKAARLPITSWSLEEQQVSASCFGFPLLEDWTFWSLGVWSGSSLRTLRRFILCVMRSIKKYFAKFTYLYCYFST